MAVIFAIILAIMGLFIGFCVLVAVAAWYFFLFIGGFMLTVTYWSANIWGVPGLIGALIFDVLLVWSIFKSRPDAEERK